MPIDVSLIRASKDGGVPEEVKKWQLARLPGDLTASVCTNAIQAEEFILRVQELENSRRLLLKEQSDKRSLLKRLQKQLAPRVGDDDSKVQKHVDEIRNEIKVLKCEVLPFVEKELEDKIKSLRKKFVKLANFVDTTPLSGTANKFYRLDSSNKNESLNSTLASRGYRDIFADVLLSIGGCIPAGTLNISDGKKSDSITREKVVLSGIGSVISSGINSYAKEFFSDFEIIHLPRIISLPIPMVHDILGCKRGCIERTSQPICKICEAKDKGTVDVPSFIGLAVMNKDKTFHERMLPQKMLCPTRSEEGHSRFLHDVEEILLTAFSVSNINISRSLQDEIAQKIKLFCISLLVLSDTNSSKKLGSRVSFLSTTSGKQIIQLRVLEPSKLEMNECRRICIEGYLPSKNTYVELARVSNCASFVSRSLKIKCGGSNNKAQGIEFVHLVHGKAFYMCNLLLRIHRPLINLILSQEKFAKSY